LLLTLITAVGLLHQVRHICHITMTSYFITVVYFTESTEQIHMKIKPVTCTQMLKQKATG